MIDIPKLLEQLDDMSAWGERDMSRSYLLSLCKQSAAAIRQLQTEATRSMAAEHATFLLKLSDGLKELGARMQSHA